MTPPNCNCGSEMTVASDECRRGARIIVWVCEPCSDGSNFTAHVHVVGSRPPMPTTAKELADILGVEPSEVWDAKDSERTE